MAYRAAAGCDNRAIAVADVRVPLVGASLTPHMPPTGGISCPTWTPFFKKRFIFSVLCALWRMLPLHFGYWAWVGVQSADLSLMFWVSAMRAAFKTVPICPVT